MGDKSVALYGTMNDLSSPPKAHLLIAGLAQSKWVIRALIAHLDDSRWVISTGAFGVKKRSFIVPRPLYAHRPSPNRPLGFRRFLEASESGIGLVGAPFL